MGEGQLLVVEEKKPSSERGYYLDPLLYKKPEERNSLEASPQAAKRVDEVLKKQGAQVRKCSRRVGRGSQLLCHPS
jgi:hypothetical protein